MKSERPSAAKAFFRATATDDVFSRLDRTIAQFVLRGIILCCLRSWGDACGGEDSERAERGHRGGVACMLCLLLRHCERRATRVGRTQRPKRLHGLSRFASALSI